MGLVRTFKLNDLQGIYTCKECYTHITSTQYLKDVKITST